MDEYIPRHVLQDRRFAVGFSNGDDMLEYDFLDLLPEFGGISLFLYLLPEFGGEVTQDDDTLWSDEAVILLAFKRS